MPIRKTGCEQYFEFRDPRVTPPYDYSQILLVNDARLGLLPEQEHLFRSTFLSAPGFGLAFNIATGFGVDLYCECFCEGDLG